MSSKENPKIVTEKPHFFYNEFLVKTIVMNVSNLNFFVRLDSVKIL